MTTRQFHPEELSLLAAIHANPREDTPRLVYADWLQEHDQPEYAEFIRLECGFLPPDLTIDGRKNRIKELKRSLDTNWPGGLPNGVFFYGYYRRGIPLVSCSISQSFVKNDSIDPFLRLAESKIHSCFRLALRIDIKPSGSDASHNWIDPKKLFACVPPSRTCEVSLSFLQKRGRPLLSLNACEEVIAALAASNWPDPSRVESLWIHTPEHRLQLHAKRLVGQRFPNLLLVS